MARAKTLTPPQVRQLFNFARDHSLQPERDRCFIALSYCAALRAQEIALMELRDVTDAAGALGPYIYVSARAAKYGKPRAIPMPQEVREALSDYLRKYPIQSGPLFFNQFDAPTTPTAVQKQLARIGRGAGFDVSSHSGRRTCLTLAAQKVHLIGGSLRDVQLLAGHADLATTQMYIESSPRHAELLERLYEPLAPELNHAQTQVAELPIISPQDKGPGAAAYFRRARRFHKMPPRN